jgi:hypothetical protein
MTGRAPRGVGRNTYAPHDTAIADVLEQGCEGDRLFENPVTFARRAALDAVGRLAQIIASLGDCSLLTLTTLAAVSLLTVFQKAPALRGADHVKSSHERGADPANGVEL